LVNINTASARELEALPGIGPVRAEAIVRSRQEEGPFQSIDDLVTRKLIPRSVLEDIKDKVTVGP
jgi:competence protein ComEA